MTPDYRCLQNLAHKEVRRTIERLPAHLRRHAEHLPVTCEPRPNPAILEDGFDPDLLGLFVGKSFGEEESGTIDVPAQIILFVENLWDFAEGSEEVYLEEVRITYLHELGHYLGLDEIDLEERGLD